MRLFYRIIKIIIPAALLISSLVVYLEWVDPLAEANQSRKSAIHNTSRTLFNLIEERGIYPSEKTIGQLTDWAKTLEDHIEKLSRQYEGKEVSPEENIDLDALYKDWGYLPGDPLVIALESLEKRVLQIMGEKNRDRALRFVYATGASLCKAGLNGLEKLECHSLPDEIYSDVTAIKSFEIVVGTHESLSETYQFIEEWVRYPGEGVFIRPVKMALLRTEPSQWNTDLKLFSGPPVNLELHVKIFYTIDKG